MLSPSVQPAQSPATSAKILKNAKQFAWGVALAAGAILSHVGDAGASVPRDVPKQWVDTRAVNTAKLTGDYGDINLTYLQVQEMESRIQKLGLSVGGRNFEFEEIKNLKNPLKTIFNDGDYLKKMLGRKVKDVTGGVSKMTNENAESMINEIFSAREILNDRAWLRHGDDAPYTDWEMDAYIKSVRTAHATVILRMQIPRFRKYAIERFNVFAQILEKNGLAGRKTFQTVFTGIIALADAAEYAEHLSKTGAMLSKNRMTPFNFATNIWRLVCILNGDAQILRLHISLPEDAPEKERDLIYFIPQLKQAIIAFGKTEESYTVNGWVAADILFDAMKNSMRDIMKVK